jgi:hypothetical protein
LSGDQLIGYLSFFDRRSARAPNANNGMLISSSVDGSGARVVLACPGAAVVAKHSVASRKNEENLFSKNRLLKPQSKQNWLTV